MTREWPSPLIPLLPEGRPGPTSFGDEAAIYAIGPGLDGHDFTKDPSLRLAINETSLVVPLCYGVVWDGGPAERIGDYCTLTDDLPPPMIVSADVWFGRRPEDTSWVAGIDHNLYFERKAVQKANARFGTGAVAVCLAIDAGARRLTLVGFDTFWDGPDGHGISKAVQGVLDALGAEPAKKGRERGSVAAYLRHREGIRRLAATHGVELVRG